MISYTQKENEIVQKVKNLLDDGWCQGTFARTNEGDPVDALDPRARQFCPIGAFRKVSSEMKLEIEEALKLTRILTDLMRFHYYGYESIPSWNDSVYRQKSQVIKLFDQFISNMRM